MAKLSKLSALLQKPSRPVIPEPDLGAKISSFIFSIGKSLASLFPQAESNSSKKPISQIKISERLIEKCLFD